MGKTEAWEKAVYGKGLGTGQLVQCMYMAGIHEEEGVFKLLDLESS